MDLSAAAISKFKASDLSSHPQDHFYYQGDLD